MPLVAGPSREGNGSPIPPPPELTGLVERFRRNIDDYRSGRYNETQVPKNTPVPLTDKEHWDVCRRLHTRASVVRLGDEESIAVNRGEVNQTIYRRYITDNPRGARLVKGVEIGRYVVHKKLSQGHREWLDERAFLRENAPRSLVVCRRIATQRITGVDERLRIVATVIDPPAYFADSTNSIAAKEAAPYTLEYLLGLLNSSLYQWRFKITSTNNNVGTNELAEMPFRTIDFSDADDERRHDRMVKLVQRMLDLHKKLPKARTAHERTVIERDIAATDRRIDLLVYELYGLTNKEIGVVEEATAKR